jgi:UDP-4-amino-4-deoxy-L-arabinose-oxoglutarate aminotransferase
VKVDFYRHDLGPEHASLVANVLSTAYLTSGNVGRKVEDKLCGYFGARHAALVNSWTNGAVAALLALDIGPGDEVIVPAQTFIATANVAELIGAKPVFVDVDPATLLMRPERVRTALTPRTRAVIPVHLYGQMVDIAMLKAALSDRPDIAIIEDSAHCFEGEFGGSKPGQHSTCAIFSFYATKNVTCGEGGAIVTNDSSFYERVVQTRMHGMSAAAVDRFKLGGYQHWDMLRMGMKANLSDLLASLLPEQIDKIDERLHRREELCSVYERAFADTAIRIPGRITNGKHARHLFVIHVPPQIRDQAIMILGHNGIGITVNYRSVPTMTFYREKYGYDESSFPISYEWGAGTISLPLYLSLAGEQQNHVITVVKDHIAALAERIGRKQ